MKDEPRLIIPFLDENKQLFGFQGRSFRKDDDLKYITILLDESKPKMFGLDTVDPNKTVYAFEGPIDSLFIPNSVASAGGRIDTNLLLTSLSKSNIVIVYDNEPRNKETIQKMESAIDLGYKIVIWPEHIKEKDINDMILSGSSSSVIKNILEMNIYNDLAAKLKLITWKKA
jgi:DNA primase